MVNTAGRRRPALDSRVQRGHGQPGVDGAADRVADHAARPSVEDHCQIDEAHGDGDVGEVGHPKLVGAVDGELLGAVGEDRLVVIAVGGSGEPSARPRLEIVLTASGA